MLVPVIVGSDKKLASKATGQVEYYPLYGSVGNLQNVARRAHGGGVVLIAFLSIPESKLVTHFRQHARELEPHLDSFLRFIA